MCVCVSQIDVYWIKNFVPGTRGLPRQVRNHESCNLCESYVTLNMYGLLTVADSLLICL